MGDWISDEEEGVLEWETYAARADQSPRWALYDCELDVNGCEAYVKHCCL